MAETSDEQLAHEIRARLSSLNEVLAAAARSGLRVEMTETAHQTSGGAPMVVLEAIVYKRL
jgi:hypothetical protein